MNKYLKKILSLGLAAFMAAGTAFSSAPIQAEAATYKASNLTQLGEILNRECAKRVKKLKVDCSKMSDADYEAAACANDYRVFSYYMVKAGDKTEDVNDGDYLAGNIDFSDGFDAEGDSKGIVTYTFKYFESAAQTKKVDTKSIKVLNSILDEDMSDYEVVLAVHKYVCNQITYTNNKSSAYNALYEKKGLCNSYALTMYKLLMDAGVPCKFIGGKAGTGRDSDGHAWNIVKLGKYWYYLDATWNDEDATGTYNLDYFLKGSKDFDSKDPSQKHTLDEEYNVTRFLKDYPIAKTAYQVTEDDCAVTYKFNKVINGKYPTSGSTTVKKGKTDDLQLYIGSKNYYCSIRNISYKISSGKDYVTVTDLSKIADGDDYFIDLEVKGKKAGTSKITVTVTMDNGESKSYAFTVKVK